MLAYGHVYVVYVTVLSVSISWFVFAVPLVIQSDEKEGGNMKMVLVCIVKHLCASLRQAVAARSIIPRRLELFCIKFIMVNRLE